MRILIIDDHDIVRRGMISLLHEYFKEAKVGEAGNARDGILAVESFPWDIVVVDISLPGRSGLDLILDMKRLRPSLPVLVMSSHSEKDYALRALKSGAAGYITKECAADILITAVQRILSGRRYISATLAEQLAGAMAGEATCIHHDSLSNRELQVLQLIATGKSIKEISSDLALSEKTVATYRSRITLKMGISTNVELTRYAMHHGLVE